MGQHLDHLTSPQLTTPPQSYLEEEWPERDLGQLHHHGDQTVNHTVFDLRRRLQIILRSTQKDNVEAEQTAMECSTQTENLETDLAVFGTEVQRRQEEGGEL